MVDVFISYARENHDVAKRLAEAIGREGYRVWWDEEIPPHLSYSQLIGEKIESAKAAIVIWSRGAAASEWVRAEADIARAARKLIQTSVDGTTPPLPFNLIQFAAIGGWNGEEDHPGWKAVKTSIAALCGPPAPAAPVDVPAPPPVAAPPPPPPPPPPVVAPAPPPEPTRPASLLSTPAPAKSSRTGYIAAGAGGAALLAVAGLIWLRGDPPAPGGEPVGNQTQTLVAQPKAPPVSPPASPPPAPPVAVPPQPTDLALFNQPGAINGAGPVAIHAGPSEGFGVVARIAPGEAFLTYPQTGQWWRVRTAAGRVGFAQASRVRVQRPGENLTMDGRWSVSWTWGGVRHVGAMHVNGGAAAFDVSVGNDYRVRQDCAVQTNAPDVRIRCHNVRVVEGKGDYSPDRFTVRLAEGRVVTGEISDGNGRVRATFTRQ